MNYAELIRETEVELKELEDKQKLVQFQKRMRFLWLLKTAAAVTQAQAGAQVGWQLRQAQKMWALYRLGGAAKLLQKNANWQTGKLSRTEQAQLSAQIAAHGGAASLAAVQQHIETEFGVSYTIGGASNLCQRLKIKLKTARPVNLKKDEAEVVRYKKTLVGLKANTKMRI